MMFTRCFLIIYFFLLHSISIYAQSPPYYQFTPKNGLSSMTVHDILQDEEGFIWFATINGLSRFDGQRFVTYKTKDGLYSNSIIALSKGSDSEIYIGNHFSGINVLRDGKIKGFHKMINGSEFNVQYLLNTQNKLYAYSSFGIIIEIDKKKDTEKKYKIFNLSHIERIFLKRLILFSDSVIILTSKGLQIIKNGRLEKITIDGLPDINFNCAVSDNYGGLLLGGDNVIYRIKNNRVVSTLPVKFFEKNFISNLFIDSHQNIWFSIFGKGFFVIPFASALNFFSGDNESPDFINLGKAMGLENSQINKFFEDQEDNIWISTYESGIFCLNNFYLQNYSKKDGLNNNYINCIFNDESGKTFIGTINGINVLENGIIRKLTYNSGKEITGYINNFIKSGNDVYVSLTSEKALSNKIMFDGSKLFIFNYQSICKTNDGNFLFGSIGNNIRVQRNFESNAFSKTIFIFGDSNYLNRINHIYQDSKKNIWIGSRKGLCKLSYSVSKKDISQWEKTFFEQDTVLNSNITSIYEDDNLIWVTSSSGIARYNNDDGTLISFTSISGFDLASSSSIIVDKNKRVWVGSMKGLYLIENGKVRCIDSNSGLSANEVNSLSYDKQHDKIYIGTSNGLSILDMKLFENYSPSLHDVKFIKIVAGDSLYSSNDKLILQPEQNNIFISFTALNFSSPNSIRFKYKLNDGEWIETENNFLRFSSLKHGDYNLQLAAKIQNSDWGKINSLAFTIKPRFTETRWFELLIILFFSSISIAFTLNRLKQNKKKFEAEMELAQKINNLEHQAISSMMNPHIIFNALNSIQYLVNKNKNEVANNYIAMMAKLIRKNLDIAGNAFILLSEEISRLQLYFELESLRFDEKFSYEIIIDNEIDVNALMIPNMIIQPFVENSLWHGIMNSGKKGHIKILFSFESIEFNSISYKSIIIRIIDNGIGIQESKKIKKEDHISRGINIIEERLNLLSQRLGLQKPIMFEDLKNYENKSSGTEVIISLPPPLYMIVKEN